MQTRSKLMKLHVQSTYCPFDYIELIPKLLYLFNSQQSDKSPLTSNNTSHLLVQHTGIHS
jgi:hypothetical protein